MKDTQPRLLSLLPCWCIIEVQCCCQLFRGIFAHAWQARSSVDKARPPGGVKRRAMLVLGGWANRAELF